MWTAREWRKLGKMFSKGILQVIEGVIQMHITPERMMNGNWDGGRVSKQSFVCRDMIQRIELSNGPMSSDIFLLLHI